MSTSPSALLNPESTHLFDRDSALHPDNRDAVVMRTRLLLVADLAWRPHGLIDVWRGLHHELKEEIMLVDSLGFSSSQ